MAQEAGRRPSTLAAFAVWPRVAAPACGQTQTLDFCRTSCKPLPGQEASANVSPGRSPGGKATLSFYGGWETEAPSSRASSSGLAAKPSPDILHQSRPYSLRIKLISDNSLTGKGPKSPFTYPGFTEGF